MGAEIKGSLVSLTAAANRLGITEDLVRRLIVAGNIKPLPRLNSRCKYLIPMNEILKIEGEKTNGK